MLPVETVPQVLVVCEDLNKSDHWVPKVSYFTQPIISWECGNDGLDVEYIAQDNSCP